MRGCESESISKKTLRTGTRCRYETTKFIRGGNMKNCAWLLSLMIVSIAPATGRFLMAADNSSDEKTDVKSALRQELLSKPLDEATSSLEAAIEQSPADVELQLMRQLLVNRLMSVRKTQEAIEQAEQLNAFQMSRVQEAIPSQNLDLAASAQVLRSLYLQAQKPDQAHQTIATTLEALRTVAGKDEDGVYLLPIAQLVSATAQGLAMEEKFAEAEELLKRECVSLQQGIEANPSAEKFVQAWATLMQSRISTAMRAESENVGTLSAELDAGIQRALEKNAQSLALMSVFIRIRSSEVARTYRDTPEAAQTLLTSTVEFVNASELKSEKAIETAVERLKSYESRIAAALLVLELINKPAPALDIEAWAHGTELTAEELKGKVVLLDFWAVWCGPCIATFPHLKEWHDAYHDKGLEIVGVTHQYGFEWDAESSRAAKAKEEVSLESEMEMLDKFMSHHELRHATIITPKESEMQKQFGVTGIPHAVLIDRQGNVRMIKVGSGPKNAEALHELIEQLLAE